MCLKTGCGRCTSRVASLSMPRLCVQMPLSQKSFEPPSGRMRSLQALTERSSVIESFCLPDCARSAGSQETAADDDDQRAHVLGHRAEARQDD